DLVAGELAHDPRQHRARNLSFECCIDVRRNSIDCRHRGEPQFPEFSIGGRVAERVGVLASHRLQPYPMTFECDRIRGDHTMKLSAIADPGHMRTWTKDQ